MPALDANVLVRHVVRDESAQRDVPAGRPPHGVPFYGRETAGDARRGPEIRASAQRLHAAMTTSQHPLDHKARP